MRTVVIPLTPQELASLRKLIRREKLFHLALGVLLGYLLWGL